MLDLAAIGTDASVLHSAINEADRLDLIDPEALRAALDQHVGEPGSAGCGHSSTARRSRSPTRSSSAPFCPIARAAGLPPPLTQQWVNGFRVDFFWPDLGLVVETDGLRYHRTAVRQARDRRRDQAHTAAGLVPLRFTRAQVKFEPGHVRATLGAVARRITSAG